MLVALAAACSDGEDTSSGSEATSTSTTVLDRAIGQPTDDGSEPDSALCTTLGAINADEADLPVLPPYDHLAEVTALLAADASDPQLRADLELMSSSLGGVTATSEAGEPVLPALAALMAPDLVEAEHRVAMQLAERCGVLLADPSTWPPTPSQSTVATGEDARSRCEAWPQQTNALLNNRFPYTIDTSGANYWGFRYSVDPGGWIELHGRYPDARYFSILPNDEDTNNLAQLTDVHIDPDPGSTNPWRTTEPTDGDDTYTVRLRFDEPPEDPEPNTSYVGLRADGTTPSQSGQVVFRIYGSDEGDHPNSAGVPLPAVTVYGPDGAVLSEHPECDPYPDGPPDIEPSEVPSMPPLPFVSQRTPAEPTLSASSAYEQQVDLLSNPDVQYLSFFFSQRYGDLVVVRGEAITTPDTRSGESPSYEGMDAQGWTLCSYNVAAGIANTCLLDHELPVDQDGYYTAVVSRAEDRPDNATTDDGVGWLDWGPYLDNQVSFRLFPRSSEVAEAIAADVEAGERTDPHTPEAVYCTRETFEAGGADACFGSPPLR